jgi:hypothetical protein
MDFLRHAAKQSAAQQSTAQHRSGPAPQDPKESGSRAICGARLKNGLTRVRDLDNRQGEIMDTISATEDMTPRSLDTHIQDCWDQEHETDPARAADLIIERLRKDGATPEAVICECFGIRFFESDALLQAIIAEEYARSLSAEDRLVYGAGLRPLTARCLIAVMDCAAAADEVADELMEALAQEDFTPLCRRVREQTGLTDAAEAAYAMLAQIPALAEMMYGIPVIPNTVSHPLPLPDTCEHRARTHVLTALAYHYEECLEQREGGEPVDSAGKPEA